MPRTPPTRRPALWLAAFVGLGAGPAAAAEPPRFIVPGHERAMQSLERLHGLHAPAAFSTCTLWDG